MALRVHSFKEPSSCRGIHTPLYDKIEVVNKEIAEDDEMLVPAVVCSMVKDCKAQFVGNHFNGTIEVT